MTFIPCTSACIYQLDGVCMLERAVPCGDQADGELCAYYVRKATPSVNTVDPDTQSMQPSYHGRYPEE